MVIWVIGSQFFSVILIFNKTQENNNMLEKIRKEKRQKIQMIEKYYISNVIQY